MHAAIDDVHHRHRQGPGRSAADITIKRHVEGIGRRLGAGKRHAEDGIGSEPALVRRTVELDHGLVDLDLVFGRAVGERLEDLAIDGLDRLAHALAEIARLVSIAQFDRLMRAGRGARRHRRAAHRTILQHDIDLDGGVAAAVQDFAADDVDDGGHDCLFGRWDRAVGAASSATHEGGKGRVTALPRLAKTATEKVMSRKPNKTAKSPELQLGRAVEWPHTPEAAQIDRVPNPQADTDYLVRFTVPE